MENIFIEPAREYKAPKFSRFGGIAPFSHSSAAPEMFFERDDEFGSILFEDKKERDYTAPKIKTRKSAVVSSVGVFKKNNAAKHEIPRRMSKPLVKSTIPKKNVKKEKCSE